MAALDLGAEDKKKLYILGGLLGLFGIVALVVFNPFGGRRPASTATPSSSANSTVRATPALTSRPAALTAGGLSPNPLGSSPVRTTSVAGTTGGGVPQYIAFRQARRDPFVPHYIPALPPTPKPPPPPAPLAPLILPEPGSVGGSSFPSGGGFQNLPPAGILAPSNSGDNGILTNLPTVRIPQYTPRATPRMTSSNPFSGASGGSESSTARLAGVVIGDSVRALVEVTTSSGQVVSRVVQPGDEIEGIRILRLERITEGGQSVTRMTVSQNGREQYFTLRPSSRGAGSTGLGTGFGGVAGGFGVPSGGFPTPQ